MAATARKSIDPKQPDFSLKDFKGVNTQANRTAIEENQFAWLENVMPIGYANLRVLPFQGAPVATIASVTIKYWKYVNINLTDYLIAVSSAGGVYAVNLATYAVTTVAAATTITLPVALSQWTNDRVLFIAANGYFDWDGTTFTTDSATFTFTGSITSNILTVTVAGSQPLAVGQTISASGITVGTYITEILTGTGGIGTYDVTTTPDLSSGTITATPTAPSAGSTIATFAGRVWIGNGRTVTFSAPGSYTDFQTADAAGSFTITDETLQSVIISLFTANNFLYVVGSSSFNVVSDVRVVGSPAITVFSNTNVSALIGSNFPWSIFAFYRTIAFATNYGFYGLSGSTPQKMSDDLDGIIPLIDFTKPVSGCVAKLFSILCICFAFTYNDPVAGPRKLLALFFNKKWFFASQGSALTLIAGGFQSGVPAVFGTDGTNIYNLFSDSTSNINTIVQTALWPMKSPTTIKYVMKGGIEVTSTIPQVTVTGTIDTEHLSLPLPFGVTNTVEWINDSGMVIGWTNNAGSEVDWITSGFQFFASDVEQVGRYYGFTLNSASPAFTYNGIMSQYEPGPDWGDDVGQG